MITAGIAQEKTELEDVFCVCTIKFQMEKFIMNKSKYCSLFLEVERPEIRNERFDNKESEMFLGQNRKIRDLETIKNIYVH